MNSVCEISSPDDDQTINIGDGDDLLDGNDDNSAITAISPSSHR